MKIVPSRGQHGAGRQLALGKGDRKPLAGAHHFAGRSHLGPQHDVDAHELAERKHALLDRDVAGDRLAFASPARPATRRPSPWRRSWCTAWVGAADAVIADLDLRAPCAPLDPHRGVDACACLAMFASASRPRSRPPSRPPARAGPRRGTRRRRDTARAVSDVIASSRPRSVQQRRPDPACQIAQLGERALGPSRASRTSCAASASSPAASFCSARPSSIATATIRACAPSCRSRSIRSSSSRAASTAPARVSSSCSTRSLELARAGAEQTRRHRAPRCAAPWTSSGPIGSRSRRARGSPRRAAAERRDAEVDVVGASSSAHHHVGVVSSASAGPTRDDDREAERPGQQAEQAVARSFHVWRST